MSTEQIVFGPFRFDPVALQLWKDGHAVAIQPKPLAVLRCLATRSGQVVTKQTLLREVWAGTYVTQAVLKVAVRALREALGESADASQYIETVGREGYRFLEEVVSDQVSVVSRQKSELALSPQPLPPVIVGRETELAKLHKLLGKALDSERQFVFVTGEPGIGKTTLVEAFRQRLETRDWRLAPSSQVSSPKPQASLLIGDGQCIEQYGAGEAYLPVLEALGRLCREEDGQ